MTPPASSKKVAVVTGSSSGIGYDASLTLARNGFLTYATMRNTGKGQEIESVAKSEGLPLKIVQLDVTDAKSVRKAIDHISAPEKGEGGRGSSSGRIDVLVNNAGYGIGGAFEDSSVEEAKDMYETNFFGLIRVTQAVLPHMRRQGSGRVINISSAAGKMGYPAASIYVSSKFAVEGLSESMAFELEPFGIKVILVEPGVVKTHFAGGMVVARKAQDPGSPYSQMMQRMAGNWTYMFENGSPPELVSRAILEAATSDSPQFRYVVGKDAEGWIQARKGMSDSEFYDMLRKNLLQ